MTIAAKHLDPLVGLDTHIILIPTPAGPVPTPLPHPYIGILFDPFDYAPFVGASTYINGLPRGVAGTNGKAVPPHIPMGGPFAKPPTNESEIFMGSATVLTDGDPQSFLGLPVLSCQDIGMPAPPRPKKKSVAKTLLLPTTVILCIPMGMLVLIGGPPTVSMMAIAQKLGLGALKRFRASKLNRKLSRKFHKLADKASDKLKLGNRARNLVHKTICTVTGHPVDVATGKVFTDKIDFALGGPIPVEWERTWFSTSTYAGPLGHGWHHRYDQVLYFEEDFILYQTADGRHVGLPRLKEGGEHFDATERLTVSLDKTGYAVRNAAGLVHRFARVPGRSGNDAPLVEIHDADGNSVRLYYDGYGRLACIVDCAGRAVEMIHDEAGRVVALTTQHPDVAGQRIYLARYAYDHAGDLTTVWDALGQPASYVYQHHLLVRETDRNGLSFYFAYDAFGEHAKCIRTWGDGGIYDHKLAYDTDGSVTVVEDSLGYKTAYFHDGALVVKTVDALGNTTETEYDENRRIVSETDALGRKSSYVYDERGNLAVMEGPDGATVRFENGRHDRPERGIDALGGEWLWIREPSGRLLERRDPLGNVMKYQYHGARLVGLTDPGGGRTTIEHDEAGNPCAVVTADGAVTRFAYDFHGRLTTVTDALGNVERRQFDLLGRLARIDEVNGNSRAFSYDPEGNVVRVKDELHDVSYGYRGMGRLVSRSEAGTTVCFEYDTEEQLVAVVNQHGSVYRFELGPTGEVVAESGFDGLLRRYSHDAAGRVVRVERPRGAQSLGEAENSAEPRVTEYHYDAADRITRVVHSDGRIHQFAYRADGQMTAAISPDAAVTFERDALGRVVRETRGAFWVESEFDPLGSRVRTRSSMGADHRVTRNAVGDVVGVRDVESSYETRFERDRLGRELERSLPGGLRSRWQRDRDGRPLQHTVEGQANTLRAVAFQWDSGSRLRRLIDAATGAIEYGYDALGALASAKYPDQSFELRMPDAVGNLFKTQERGDRRYGAAGQLLSARTPGGWVEYAYDVEGNLIRKTEPSGRVWHYSWSTEGTLAKVTRPDGTEVTFRYDALGRRVSKHYRGQTTHWLWDGDTPLHEWVEGELESAGAAAMRPSSSSDADSKKRDAELLQHLSQGPPSRGARTAPITWLFEPDTYVPIAKLVGPERYSIVGDQLGTPVLMADEKGKAVFGASVSTFGELRELEGSRHACPFRFQGQYEDAETGLYYNRFRYYDPESGTYLSQDPIGLAGGPALYAYVPDPLVETDPLGLKKCGAGKTPVFWSSGGNPRVKAAAQKWARENGGTTLEMTGKGSFLERSTKGMDWLEVGPAWDKSSKHFAKRAAKQGGPVHVFVSKSSPPGPQSVWKRVEEPILRKDPNRQIIIHEVP